MIFMLLYFGAPLATAASNPFLETDESEYYRMEDELITVASRYAESARTAPNIVSVVSQDDIRDRNYRTLSDALRDLPGVYVWKSGEGRDLASFRGVISADNNKFLLLIDGVPWYDGVYTHAWIDQYLPIQHVKQIEVLKGPGSAVYGTNAFAGVVNVVTVTGAEREGVQVTLDAGSFGSVDLAISGGTSRMLASKEFDVSAYARVYSQIGDGLDVNPRGDRNIRGDDPKRSVNVGTKLKWAGFEAQFHHVDYRHSYLVGEVDDLFDHLAADTDSFGLFYANTFFDLRYRFNFGNRIFLTPVVWMQRHDNPGAYSIVSAEEGESGNIDAFDISVVETEKDTVRFGAHLDMEGRFAPGHVTVAGFGVERVRVLGLYDTSFQNFSSDPVFNGFGAPTGSGLTNVFGFAQHSWNALPQLSLVAGIRLDKRITTQSIQSSGNTFKLALSPRIAIVANPIPILATKLLYGRAFRAPNVRETLVSTTLDPDTGEYPFSNGSLDVGPEKIDTVELEVSVDAAPIFKGAVVGFFSRVDGEIDKVSPPNEYVNLSGGLNIWGVEVSAASQVHWFTFRAAYSFTDARYRGGQSSIGNPYSGRQQYEFPPHMVKGSVRMDATDAFQTTVSGELYSKRPRRDWAADSGLPDGPAVALLHMAARIKDIGKQDNIELTAGIRNILDTKNTVGSYRDEVNRVRDGEALYTNDLDLPGRSVHVGFKLSL